MNKQTRVRFSSSGDENAYDSYHKKTLKGERKQGQSWFQRQFSDQMSDSEDSVDYKFETAVAAATFAINSLDDDEDEDEEGNVKWKRTNGELRRTLTKKGSKRDRSGDKPSDYGKFTRWFSGKEVNEDRKSSGDISMKKPTAEDQKFPEHPTSDQKEPRKTPTFKKTPSLSDRYLTDGGSKRYEQRQDPRKGQHSPAAISSEVEEKANSWEKAKMAKIKKRHERLISTILEWENEKKAKANRRMERKEMGTEERRERVLHEYRNEISRIEKIAGSAREVADERKRNDEEQIIERANVFRSTGKLPSECTCF